MRRCLLQKKVARVLWRRKGAREPETVALGGEVIFAGLRDDAGADEGYENRVSIDEEAGEVGIGEVRRGGGVDRIDEREEALVREDVKAVLKHREASGSS